MNDLTDQILSAAQTALFLVSLISTVFCISFFAGYFS